MKICSTITSLLPFKLLEKSFPPAKKIQISKSACFFSRFKWPLSIDVYFSYSNIAYNVDLTLKFTRIFKKLGHMDLRCSVLLETNK